MSILRQSSIPYLLSISLTYLLAGYVHYLTHLGSTSVTFKGHSFGILLPLAMVPISIGLWLIYQGRPCSSVLLRLFLLGLVIAWTVHFALTQYHNDLYTHAAWLFVPTLFMVLMKTPSEREAWKVIWLLSVGIALILILTRVLEIVQWIPQFYYPPPDIVAFERSYYWLPFAGQFGVESRWPGPFGYNTKTGFMGALIIVVALVKWHRVASPVLITIGVLTVLLTGGRSVYLSLVASLSILVLFNGKLPIARAPATLRWLVVVSGAALTGYLFATSGAGSTGRLGDGGIWDSFLDLWKTNPILGVGQQAILNSQGLVGKAMEAHNIYLQELTEYGLLGFAVQYFALILGAIICIQAANRRNPGPLAILVLYSIVNITEVLHDSWLHHSVHTMLIVLCVLASQSKSPSVAAQSHISVRPAA